MIVFRTEASPKTGFGHLKRSVYLASLLKSKCEVLFCINNDKSASRFLVEKQLSFIHTKEFQKIKNSSITGIIFDLRNFTEDDTQVIQRARKSAAPVKTVQITDLGLCQQDADFTIDSALDKIVPYDETRQKSLLDGPDFAILHHRFRHFNKIKRKYRQKIKNVLICLGGGATYRHLRIAVDLLSRRDYRVKIAPGFYLKKSSPKTLRRLYPGVHFVGPTESLARAFYEADAALITAGVAAFEAAAAGTPGLYLHYHDEQKRVACAFEKQGAGVEISNIDDLLSADLAEKMNRLTFEKRLDMGNNGKKLVDGKGVYRIIDFFKNNNII